LSTRQQRIQNRIRNQMMIKTLMRGFLALTIIIGIGGLMLFLYHQTCLRLIKVDIAQYGELQVKTTVPAILIKKETVVKAPARGRFENQVMEGERMRSGAVAGLFYPEGEIKPVALSVPLGGVVSFKPDGWEDVLKDFSLENGDHNIFNYTPRQLNDGSFQYERGEPLLKIIDNLMPMRMVVTIQLSALSEPLAASDLLQVMYQDRVLGDAECESVWSGKDRQTAILNFDYFDGALLDLRKIEVDCITDTYQGLIIPEKALVKNQNGVVVYKVDKGKVLLCDVKVLAVYNGQAVIEGLEPGDTVVTTPGLVSDGMRYW